MLSALIAEIENYWLSVAELEAWLAAGEAKLDECGPFGADLPRLVEQSALLEVWVIVSCCDGVTLLLCLCDRCVAVMVW